MKLSNIKIQSGVPLPNGMGGTKEQQRERLLSRMKVGDSFYSAGNINDFLPFYTSAKKLKIKVMIRKHNGGYRLWRLK